MAIKGHVQVFESILCAGSEVPDLKCLSKLPWYRWGLSVVADSQPEHHANIYGMSATSTISFKWPSCPFCSIDCGGSMKGTDHPREDFLFAIQMSGDANLCINRVQ